MQFRAPLVATEGGSPHFLRALGLAAPLGVAIGLGALEIVEQARRRWNRGASWLAIAAVAVTLTAVALWSGWAYFTRPPADRYSAFSFSIVSLASYAAEHPGSAAILDDYSAMDIEFLDASEDVTIYKPGSNVADPTARFHDLGADYYTNHLDKDKKIRSHVRQLQALGFTVTLEHAAA